MTIDDDRLHAFLFPRLFPYGCGVPINKSRRVKVSAEEAIAHLLRLADNRFTADITFVLYSFSAWSQAAALRGGLISAKIMTSEEQQKVITLEPQHVKSYMEWQHACFRAGFSGVPRPRMPDALKQTGVSAAMTKIKSHAKHVPGSDDRRARHRSNLQGYVQRWGNASLFVTVSPDSAHNICAAFDAGRVDVDDFLSACYEPESFQLPDRYEVFHAVSKAPAAQARTFDRFFRTFIADFLGWDSHTQRPFRDRGSALGRTEAFYALVETQARGT